MWAYERTLDWRGVACKVAYAKRPALLLKNRAYADRAAAHARELQGKGTNLSLKKGPNRSPRFYPGLGFSPFGVEIFCGATLKS